MTGSDLTARLAHRWPGFSDDAIDRTVRHGRLDQSRRDPVAIPGPLAIRIWPAIRPRRCPRHADRHSRELAL